MPKTPPPEAGQGKPNYQPSYPAYNNVQPSNTPLANRPNYDPDMNKRVEWEHNRGPSRPVTPSPDPLAPKKK